MAGPACSEQDRNEIKIKNSLQSLHNQNYPGVRHAIRRHCLSSPYSADDIQGWLVRQNRLLLEHAEGTRIGDVRSHVYEDAVSIDFSFTWESQTPHQKDFTFKALFCDLPAHRDRFSDLDLFTAWKKAIRKHELAPRNKLAEVYKYYRVHMLLNPFWHVFRLVNGHTSTDFITLWESLQDDIPKDPMDVQRELPLSRYQGDRPDASARGVAPQVYF
ncbi:hypothetical protein B0H13DRAFT_1904053 [Mycena leptocephala]|nr:hypothetical protein B0H13DRAFT_1904053 [Mycena leptocephala]